jgi:outer membrane protein assembly factor BamB
MTASRVLLSIALASFAFLFMPSVVAKDDDPPYELVEIRDRDGKEIYRTAWGRGGRVGFFRDVDADGVTEFVALTENRRDLELSVLELDTDVPRLSFLVGENEAAGLYALNLDADDQLEYIVGYGSKLQDRVKRTLIQFASALGTLSMGWTAGNYQYYYMISTGVNVDVRHIKAVDDNGSVLWDRDLSSAGENWTNPRFKWVASHAGDRGGTVLVTDDAANILHGLSAETGTTIWSRELRGDVRASRRQFQPLTDGERELPVLFSENQVLVLDPISGDPVLDTSLERNIASLPSWQIFDTQRGPAFLTYGDERGDLEMLSLESGAVLWTHTMERVQEVLPLAGGQRLVAVWEQGVDILDADGTLIANRIAPGEIKRRSTPVFADLDGDDSLELLYVSDRKSVIAWRPETDEHLWTGSASSGMLGAANPAQIYESFYDLDADGWLDVPAMKPSGAGIWLSGKTGEPLVEVGNGSLDPIVGDFDGNGAVEMFWAKKWYDVVPAEAD